MKKSARIDKTLAALLGALLLGGCLIFASAAFGLLARGQSNISSVVFNHLVLGIGAGMALLIFFAMIDYRTWRKYAPYIYALTVLATAAVFLPYIGSTYLGGRRWIHIANFTFQPSEALKLGTIMFAAAYFTAMRTRIHTLLYGLGGFVGVLALPIALLLLQPDVGTLGVICITVFAMFFAAGARIPHIGMVIVGALLALALLATFRPYVRDRIETFFHPANNQDTQGYQIKQSLIAIGSGGLFGRGWGQGIQKFTYLPEPMGDSIFAVASEELGFVGALVIILVFTLFMLRGLQIATHSPDMFGSLLAIGIATYLGSEAFINIGAMLGVVPLTGIPLTFVSQGGSAMLMSLASAGVLINVSRFMRRS